ncbi:MAG: hypothetical protein ACOVO1_07045 [Chitinophagaceae bacterium]
MSLFKRLLLTLPFIIISYFVISSRFEKDGCSALIEIVFLVVEFIILVLCFMLAIVTSLKKRQSGKLKIEPTSGIIIFLTSLILFVSVLFPELLKSKITIEAINKDFGTIIGNQKMLLRKNNTATFYEIDADLTCYQTIEYSILNDTIIFKNSLPLNHNKKISKRYIIKQSELIPILVDSVNSVSFNIVKKS